MERRGDPKRHPGHSSLIILLQNAALAVSEGKLVEGTGLEGALCLQSAELSSWQKGFHGLGSASLCGDRLGKTGVGGSTPTSRALTRKHKQSLSSLAQCVQDSSHGERTGVQVSPRWQERHQNFSISTSSLMVPSLPHLVASRKKEATPAE